MDHEVGIRIAKLLAESDPKTAGEIASCINVCRRMTMAALVGGQVLGIFKSKIENERLVWKNVTMENP
jgi:hypothetical protein